jgi:hypothetical protein
MPSASWHEGPDVAADGGMPQKPSPFREPPFPFQSETESAFETALQAHDRTSDAIEKLRGAVIACVIHLRDLGMEPEAVLVTMRAYLTHTMRSHFPATERTPIFESRWLVDQVATWSIEAYYSRSQE